ncbi:MAG: PucR family transcriptional regulator [Pseudopedobacter sp.]|nr:PucR family transcriptional regulator [Deinococcales bacterium]
MPLPTLQELLELPAYAYAEVLSGTSALEQPVSWVHVSEVLDAARFLSGGELLLSTGVELARVNAQEQREFLESIGAAGAVGLVLELVQSFQDVPQVLLERASQLEFPLLVFRSEVRFAELTRAAHERILKPSPVLSAQATLEQVLDALIETGRADALVEQHLGPLLHLGKRPRKVLLETLETMLTSRFNMSETARRLGIRRQTIYYRLEQLRGFLGDDFDTLERQVILLLALELLKRETPAL